MKTFSYMVNKYTKKFPKKLLILKVIFSYHVSLTAFSIIFDKKYGASYDLTEFINRQQKSSNNPFVEIVFWQSDTLSGSKLVIIAWYSKSNPNVDYQE